MINERDATTIFLESVHFNAYTDLLQAIEKIYLPEGFYDLADDPGKISDWYLSLDDEHKNLLKDILKFTTLYTIFNFLIILDNSDGYPVQGTISEFALYLQTYDSLSDKSSNLPKEALRINRSSAGEELLTDFSHAIRKELGLYFSD